MLTESIKNFAVTALGMLIRFSVGVVLARSLGVDTYGQYAALIIFAEIARSFAMSGLNVPLTRYTVKYFSKGKIRETLSTYYFFSTLIICASVASGLLFILVLEWFQPRSIYQVPSTTLMLVVLFPVVGNGVAVVAAATVGIGKVARSKVPEQIIRPMLLGIFVGFFFFIDNDFDALLFVIIANLVAMLISLVFATSYFRRRVYCNENASSALPNRLTMLVESKPFVLMGLLIAVSTQVDALILGTLADPRELAYFNIGIQLSLVVSLPMFVAIQVAYPRLTAQFELNDNQAVARTFWGTTIFPYLLILPVAAILFAYSEVFISIVFGSEYVPAASVLKVFLVTGIILNPLLVAPQLFSASGNVRLPILLLPLSILLSIVLSTYLIPIYGAVGAALSLGASQILLNLILFCTAIKRFSLIGLFRA
jgi:O-antigen/teichoic acid export membrane protein